MDSSITGLKPHGFLLLRAVKNIVCGEPAPGIQTLHQRAHVTCDTIRTQPRAFERVRQYMMRRVHASIASYGGHFKHLLWH